MIRKIIALVFVLPILAIALPSNAQTNLSCADITFSAELTARYPEIDDACQGVVEIDGEKFALMTVELIRTAINRARFRFKENDGDWGPSQTINLDADWRANIGGQSYRIHQLQAGQELNIYIPANRWEVHVPESRDQPVTTWVGFILYDDDFGEELPMTASEMPLLGLLGGSALFVAFLMRLRRRRS